jgi:hypothetical protein
MSEPGASSSGVARPKKRELEASSEAGASSSGVARPKKRQLDDSSESPSPDRMTPAAKLLRLHGVAHRGAGDMWVAYFMGDEDWVELAQGYINSGYIAALIGGRAAPAVHGITVIYHRPNGYYHASLALRGRSVDGDFLVVCCEPSPHLTAELAVACLTAYQFYHGHLPFSSALAPELDLRMELADGINRDEQMTSVAKFSECLRDLAATGANDVSRLLSRPFPSYARRRTRGGLVGYLGTDIVLSMFKLYRGLYKSTSEKVNLWWSVVYADRRGYNQECDYTAFTMA